MPGMDGFEVIEHLKHIPRIIFSTAYGDYALKAFEANAVDYLLKPYDRKRFARAVQKAVDRSIKSNDEIERIIRVLQQSKETEGYPTHIFVRVGRKIVSVQVGDIVWIEAEGDYTRLHTDNGTHLCNLAMNTLEEKLSPSGFLRVHRSYMIAKDFVEYLTGDGEGGFIAVLKNKTRVKVSRTYAVKIRDVIW